MPLSLCFSCLFPSFLARRWFSATLLLLVFAFIHPLSILAATGTIGRVEVSQICDRAAIKAASRWDVPIDVLQAITRTETGRRSGGALRPWPWTVNMEGVGRWFDTQNQALAFAKKGFERGARSFDVGCFQINFRWHGQAFRSIEDMFDPWKNADYAARFLSELYTELGDWSAVAGAYHSRTPKFARRYRARFDRIRDAGMPEIDQALRQRAVFTAPARLELDRRLTKGPLIGQGDAAMGSLVPLRTAERTGAIVEIEGAD